MADLKALKNSINHVEEDLINIKKTIISLDISNKEKNQEAWDDIISASKEISKLWKGMSVVEEIRKQREKN